MDSEHKTLSLTADGAGIRVRAGSDPRKPAAAGEARGGAGVDPRYAALGALFAAAACQAPAGSAGTFGTGSRITTAEDGGESTNVESAGSTGGADERGGTSEGSDETAEPMRDLPAPDFGDGAPAGCRGKIDFLFMISRSPNMAFRQEQLVAAFPEFIATIESKFANFDYHIMVVDGDAFGIDEDIDGGGGTDKDSGWGSEICNAVCPNLECMYGEACCPKKFPGEVGQPCCPSPEYPCDELDQVTQCDWAWGAGTVFPAGMYTQNRRCPIDGGRRYLVTGQADLPGTFACVASVGTEGHNALGQALTAAMQPAINAPGGCNKGFLREDALLMVTFIDPSLDSKDGGSSGYPFQWADAVREAKHGDERAVVMLQIGRTGECAAEDQICELVTMFPQHLRADINAQSYGGAFAEAAALVETACAGFVPPG